MSLHWRAYDTISEAPRRNRILVRLGWVRGFGHCYAESSITGSQMTFALMQSEPGGIIRQSGNSGCVFAWRCHFARWHTLFSFAQLRIAQGRMLFAARRIARNAPFFSVFVGSRGVVDTSSVSGCGGRVEQYWLRMPTPP